MRTHAHLIPIRGSDRSSEKDDMPEVVFCAKIDITEQCEGTVALFFCFVEAGRATRGTRAPAGVGAAQNIWDVVV